MNETPALTVLAASFAVLTFTAIGGGPPSPIKAAEASEQAMQVAAIELRRAVSNKPPTKRELAELAAVVLLYGGPQVSASKPTYFVDADTFDIPTHIANGWTVPVRLRLKNVNAPESYRPKCKRERELAAQAVAFVTEALSKPGAEIRLTEKEGNDDYARYLGQITVNGKDLGQMLLEHDPPLARPWTEAHEGQTAMYWCENNTPQ